MSATDYRRHRRRRTGFRSALSSAEYQQNWVRASYQQLRHRQADETGLAAFTGALHQRVAEELVLAAITGSSEYFANLELPASC